MNQLKLPTSALLTVLLFSLLGTFSATAADSQSIERQLINKISQAKKRLAKVEKSVSSQRIALAKKLNKVEREVIELRNQTAVARRLADEKTLSITKLEQRLSTWKQQDLFQKNLLHRYIQNANLAKTSTTSAINKSDVSSQLSLVLDHSKKLNQQFFPQWQTQKVVMPNGEMITNPTLTLGPITWYWDEASEQAGLVSKEENALFQHDVYLGNSNDIATLRNTLNGEITFDPTLGQAITREQQSESVVDHVIKGGVWAVPILLFALFALIIALMKVVQLARLPKFVHLAPSSLVSLVQNKSADSATNEALIKPIKGMQRDLLDITTTHALSSQRDDLLFIKLQQCKHVLDKRISAIAITAAISPLLGLLGTVSGMIETFKMMTLFGSGDPEVVSGGIAQALVTTELGLVVAIPALILNAVLSRKAKAYYADLENFAILVSKSDEQQKADTQTSNIEGANA
ncbi:MotA/TolQ/ExbB proton channel family protein [Colwellia sp. E2M01]|nr:MotA/TolQ/ExbB proton channel family protein [Colwellia sp. E2M01]